MPKLTIDFSNATSPNFLPRHLPEGTYKGKIIKQGMAKTKSDGSDMLIYTIAVGSGTYPYYCKLVPTQLWKLRELLTAAGMKVPSKAVSIDPARIVGKLINVNLEDDTYNGQLKSVVGSVAAYNADDLDNADDDDDELDDAVDPLDDDEEEEEEEAPKPARKSARKAKTKAKAKATDVDDPDFLDFED